MVIRIYIRQKMHALPHQTQAKNQRRKQRDTDQNHMTSAYRWSIKNTTKTMTLTQEKTAHIQIKLKLFYAHAWASGMHIGHRAHTWQAIDIDRYLWSTKACENMNTPLYSLNHFSYFTVARALLVLMVVHTYTTDITYLNMLEFMECRMQHSSKPRVMKNVNPANFQRIWVVVVIVAHGLFLVNFCHLFALNWPPENHFTQYMVFFCYRASRYVFSFASRYRYATWYWTEIEIIYTCSISVPWLMMCCMPTKLHGFENESPGWTFFSFSCIGAGFLIWIAEKLEY